MIFITLCVPKTPLKYGPNGFHVQMLLFFSCSIFFFHIGPKHNYNQNTKSTIRDLSSIVCIKMWQLTTHHETYAPINNHKSYKIIISSKNSKHTFFKCAFGHTHAHEQLNGCAFSLTAPDQQQWTCSVTSWCLKTGQVTLRQYVKWFAYSFQQLELLNVFTCDVWVSENGTKPTLVIRAVLWSHSCSSQKI